MNKIIKYFIIYKLIFVYKISSINYDKCDLIVDSAICINNNEKIILPDAIRSGRILYMKFDEIYPVDSSGYGNHGIGMISGHSGFGGIGTSAYFRNNFIYVNNNNFNTNNLNNGNNFKNGKINNLNGKFNDLIGNFNGNNGNTLNGIGSGNGNLIENDFTIMFYIYMLTDEKSLQNSLKFNQFCTILHKGYKTDLINEASPEISINPLSGTIKISISLQGNKTIELTSNSKLQHHHWYHITLVRDKYDILLYINGILDMKYITKVITRTNKLPLYIGGAPFNNCDFPFLLDELSIFSHAIGMDEIQAEASFSLGGIESSYITIGCTNCTKEEGMISCPDGYHLCNKFELYTGGYKVARKLSLNINDIMASASAEPSNGIALCCTNL